MKRNIENELSLWLRKKKRKPLILRGARQIGKSWLAREVAKQNGLELLEVNFEQDSTQKAYFSSNQPTKILETLSQVFLQGQVVDPSRTLLFLDELQAAPEVISSLRYFYEDMPQLAVLGTGSLLEFAFDEKEFSMPVGRVELMFLGPMNFEEFLLVIEEKGLVEFLNSYRLGNRIPEPIHKKLLEYVREFFYIGGIPEAVAQFSTNRSFAEALQALRALAFTYSEDFHKYRRRIPHDRIFKIFKAVPGFIGSRLKYATIDPNERAEALSQALELLCKARVCYKIRHSPGEGIPLSIYARAKPFKVLFLDCGLATSLLGVTQKISQPLISSLEGSLAEQFIGQHLLYSRSCYEEPELYFWARETRGSLAEVDYLIQNEGQIVPIEVKAGKSGTLKSLHLFMEEKKHPLAIRFNADQPSILKSNFELISLPLYLVCQLRRLLE